MDRKKKTQRTLGTILFTAGILVGMVLFILMNWAYFEAYFYFGTTAEADEPLTTLRCPLLMTTSDTGQVTISLSNTTDRDLAPSVRAEISYYGAARSDRINYPIAAHESRKISWEVSSDDMVFGHLVMARVFVFSTFTLPSLSKTCGTVMVDLPWLSGMQLLAITLGFIVASMSAGWGLWLSGSRPMQAEQVIGLRAMIFFTIAVVLGLIAGFLGWWVLGLISAVACLLLILVVVGYYLQKK